jgi:GT2 family glycosyltransferase
VDTLKTDFPSIKLIKSNENLGFAGGNNLGLNHATGEYILFLNNDVEIDASSLVELKEILDEYPNCVAVSPKIYYYEAPNMFQYAGGFRMNPFTLKNTHRGTGQIDEGQYDETVETDYAHGACMMIRKADLDEIGVMDETYFLYYEEQDWCERMLRKGKTIMFAHKAKIYHKESISTGKGSALKTYYLNRNRLLFARKNFSGITFLISMFYYCLFTMPKNTFGLLRSKPHFTAYWKAIWWNLTHSIQQS